MNDDDLIRRGDAKAWFAQYPYVKGLRDAIDAIPAAPLDALTLERAALVAKRAIDMYGAKMRGTTDKKEKRDWQSMLFAAVDIEAAIRALAPEPAHVTAARVVKIKPLEWEKIYGTAYKDFPDDEQARTILGTYKLVCTYEPSHKWHEVNFYSAAKGGPLYETLEDAKAAAQADYEARIRSAIVEARHD